MIKKKLISLIAGGLLCQLGSAQQVSKVNSDQWSMTDALGRKAVEQEEIAGKKGDKVVAMFYWTWHQGNDDTTYQVKNITEIVRKNPEAMKDYNHPGWGTKKAWFLFLGGALVWIL